MLSLGLVWSRVCAFLYSLGPMSHSVKKYLENRPKKVLIFLGSMPFVFCLYTLLQVVSCYLSDLSMLVMFPKNKSVKSH